LESFLFALSTGRTVFNGKVSQTLARLPQKIPNVSSKMVERGSAIERKEGMVSGIF
jgi:hypothetical protein